MPYEGEFASYRSIHRITQTDRVKHLLTKSRVISRAEQTASLVPAAAPAAAETAPGFVVAIDGSYAEVPVKKTKKASGWTNKNGTV